MPTPRPAPRRVAMWCFVTSFALHGAGAVVMWNTYVPVPVAVEEQAIDASVRLSFASAASPPPIEIPPPPTAPLPDLAERPVEAAERLADAVAVPSERPSWLVPGEAAMQPPETRLDTSKLARRLVPQPDATEVAEDAVFTPSEREATEVTVLPATVASVDSVEVMTPLRGENPEPEYPRAAVRRGIEGEVVVRCTVAANGLVTDCEVTVSSGSTLLDRAALAAARRWKFSRGGTVDVPFVFRLQGRA